jgi:hypothetical protein
MESQTGSKSCVLPGLETRVERGICRPNIEAQKECVYDTALWYRRVAMDGFPLELSGQRFAGFLVSPIRRHPFFASRTSRVKPGYAFAPSRFERHAPRAPVRSVVEKKLDQWPHTPPNAER